MDIITSPDGMKYLTPDEIAAFHAGDIDRAELVYLIDFAKLVEMG